MTYTFNDQAVHEAVAGGKVIIRRPIGMPDKKWVKYAEGIVKALDNRAPCTALERGEAIHKAILDGAQESPSMKLVDILARELKAWPFNYSNEIGQSAAGSLHSEPYTPEYGYTAETYTMADDFEFGVVTRSEWQAAVDALSAPKADAQADDTVSLAQLIGRGYLAPIFHVDEMGYSNWPRRVYSFGLPPSLRDLDASLVVDPKPKAEPKPVEWSGEGMPPVRTVCELSSASKFTDGAKLEEFPAGTRVLVGGKANFGGYDVAVVCVESRHFCGTIIPSLLRPVRTIEQIAEQIAAEQRTKAVSEMVDTLKCFNSINEACGMLYDAGYIKP